MQNNGCPPNMAFYSPRGNLLADKRIPITAQKAIFCKCLGMSVIHYLIFMKSLLSITVKL